MIQAFVQNSSHPARRRVAAVLLAALLNLALLPCTMALEVDQDTHDCCPPKISLDPSDCCEIDDAAVDVRGDSLEIERDTAIELAPAPAYADLAASPPMFYRATAGPPRPVPDFVPLHKLNCVYLK